MQAITKLLKPLRNHNNPGRIAKHRMVGNFKRRKKILSVADVKAVLSRFFEEIELNQGKFRKFLITHTICLSFGALSCVIFI